MESKRLTNSNPVNIDLCRGILIQNGYLDKFYSNPLLWYIIGPMQNKLDKLDIHSLRSNYSKFKAMFTESIE